MLILDDWQKKFKETKGDKILCTGRQVGKSLVCSQDAGDYAISNARKCVVMIAPTERQAYGLFEKTLNYLITKYPNHLKMGKDRPTHTKITLRNGTRIFCLPVGLSGLGIRFLTIDRLYVDEASRVPEDVWNAITPALLTTGGNMVLLSTPAGAVGAFYECWINRDKKYESFTRFSINSEEVMRNRPIRANWTEEIRDKALAFLEREKLRMNSKDYAQEYLGEFIDSFFRFFTDDIIKKCCVLKRRAEISKKHDYYLGVDVARMGNDEITFEIVHRITRDAFQQVESIVETKKYLNETTDRIIELEKQYDFKEIGIDDGGIGVGVYDYLLHNPITKRKIVAINNRSRSLEDERSKKLLKEDLYANLLAMMERGEIQLLNDSDLIASFRSVQYEYLLSAGQPSRLRIFGNYTHIVEGLIRACWLASQDKRLNIWVHW